MVRSALGLAAALYFAVIGLIIIEHTNNALTLAANNEATSNTIFDVNCTQYHVLSSPGSVTIHAAIGSATINATIGSIVNPVLNDSPDDYLEGEDIKAEKPDINGHIWTEGQRVMIVTMCLGGYNSANTTFQTKQTSEVANLSIKFDNDATIGSWADLGQNMTTSYKNVYAPPQVETNGTTFKMGHDQTNPYQFGIDFLMAIAQTSTYDVSIEWLSTIDAEL